MRPHQGYIVGEGGPHIFYTLNGKGFPIVFCNGIGTSTFFWKHLILHLRDRCKLITWDYRGHGRSERPKNLADTTVQTNGQDVRRLMDHHQIEKAVLVGHSYGVQVILETYRMFPGRVLGLIPMLGTYGRPMDTFFDSGIGRVLFPVIYWGAIKHTPAAKRLTKNVIESRYLTRIAEVMGVDPQIIRSGEFNEYFSHIVDQLDFQVFAEMAKHMQDHTAEDLLDEIQVPTLVVSGDRDKFTPDWISERMVEKIPHAEHLHIPHGSHGAMFEQPELINLRFDRFLYDHFNVPLSKVGGARKGRGRRPALSAGRVMPRHGGANQ